MTAGSRRIIAGVSGSLRSLGALRAAVAEACSAGAALLAVPPPELIRELRPRRHRWRPEDFAVPLAG